MYTRVRMAHMRVHGGARLVGAIGSAYYCATLTATEPGRAVGAMIEHHSIRSVRDANLAHDLCRR